jgi:hypothetical protein
MPVQRQARVVVNGGGEGHQASPTTPPGRLGARGLEAFGARAGVHFMLRIDQ